MQLDLLVPIAGMATVLLLGLPVVRAVVRAIEARTGASRAGGGFVVLPEELADIRSQLDELREVSARLTELEERVDFAERLLTRQRELQALEKGPEPGA